MASYTPKIDMKPCPFCGCAAVLKVIWGTEVNSYADSAHCECTACRARGSGAMGDRSKPGYADNSTVGDRAVDAWNARPNVQAAPKRDRGEDRKRWNHEGFNAYLDQAITDNGEFTTWDQLTDTRDAYYGYMAGLHDGQPNELATCLTCGDRGWVGGPSFYAPDEGGEQCPDCNALETVAAAQGQARTPAAWRYRRPMAKYWRVTLICPVNPLMEVEPLYAEPGIDLWRFREPLTWAIHQLHSCGNSDKLRKLRDLIDNRHKETPDAEA